LTAQRREKVAEMKWSDISEGLWTIPSEEGEKGNPGFLILPPLALNIIQAQPKMPRTQYIFPAVSGSGHIAGWSSLKTAFDLRCSISPGWTIHDLRRTARTLMTKIRIESESKDANGKKILVRAIDSQVAEMIMGHAPSGVHGTYDRHDHIPEMGEALIHLADHIARLTDPKKVVMLDRADPARHQGRAAGH
jgi:integrase